MSSQAWPRSAAPHCSLPLSSGFAGCRHGARRQFCSKGRLHLITTSYARLAGPITWALAQPLPGRNSGPYIPAFIFFLFLNYGHRKERIYTGAPWFIKNPPRPRIRSALAGFSVIFMSPPWGNCSPWPWPALTAPAKSRDGRITHPGNSRKQQKYTSVRGNFTTYHQIGPKAPYCGAFPVGNRNLYPLKCPFTLFFLQSGHDSVYPVFPTFTDSTAKQLRNRLFIGDLACSEVRLRLHPAAV
ncbi:MAG: hypothetical protein FD189_2275 [Elusimicrobia bacterium]|nr:MAG: hypothetical protein FD154_2250 [Elusimicrobiota bacterium]KAF0153795.1 MAG: hypothetical protein FD189_2275 [Elusimicrobiota bacterium]